MYLTSLVRLAASFGVSPTWYRRIGLVVVVCSAGWSCGILGAEDESGCGPEGFPAGFGISNSIDAVTSPSLDTSLAGGRRFFGWSWLVENACTEQHVRATWVLRVNPQNLPLGWQVEAGYLLTALSGNSVAFTPIDRSATEREYQGLSGIGLKQAFPSGPGRFLLYVQLSFTSQGDFQTDREVVQRLFSHVGLFAEYRLHGDL